MVEIAGIIILGILAQWVAWKSNVPAILPLILIGLLVGPISTFWTIDGSKLIEPTWNNSSGLFPGENLFYFVELAIGIILFEGGLTLKRDEIRIVGPTILKLISLGSFVTFLGGGLMAHYIIGLSWSLSFLFSGLIIVTGPTVIAPILRNIPLKTNVSTVLKWEGILIDPIGALVAVLVFEFISSFKVGGGIQYTEHALKHFVTILLIGFSLGLIAAYTFREIIKRNWVPHYLLNVFTLAFVLSIFILSEYLVKDSGLLSLVILGMILGNIELPKIDEILYFKESISILLISILFILLSANINIEELMLVFNLKCLLLFALIVLVLRPLGVFLSTHGSTLNFNEKIFISWVGPRGIVAAGIASLFGLKLMKAGVEGAAYITPLVFMVVLGTVLLNATTARIFARLVGVLLTKSNGVLFVGANKASRLLAKYLIDSGRHVVMIDSNEKNVQKAREMGANALKANVYTDDLSESLELSDVGFLLALTSSSEVNDFAINKWKTIFGEHGAYRVNTLEEVNNITEGSPQRLFSEKDDFLHFSEVARTKSSFTEIKSSSDVDFANKIELLNSHPKSIPIFFKDSEEFLHIITTEIQQLPTEQDGTIIYLGEPISFDQSDESE